MMDMLTGKIDENELEALADEETVNGGAVTPFLTVIIVATYLAGACPTSSCTKSCNK